VAGKQFFFWYCPHDLNYAHPKTDRLERASIQPERGYLPAKGTFRMPFRFFFEALSRIRLGSNIRKAAPEGPKQNPLIPDWKNQKLI
jgi:hypothetical protein